MAARPANAVAVAGFGLLPVLVAVGLLVLPPALVVGAVLLLALPVLVLRWPLVGAFAIVFVQYLRFGETFPELAALHIDRLIYLMVILATALHWLMHRRRLARHPILWVLFAMLGVMALGIPMAYWRSAALDTTEGFAKVLVGVLLLTNLVDSERALVQLVYVLGLAMVTVCARTLYGYEGGRAFGPSLEYGNANELAGTLTSVMPLLLLVGLRHRLGGALGRLFLVAAWVPMLVVVVLTNSRAGAVGLVAAMLLLSLKARRRVLALGASGLVLLVAWVAMGPERRERILSIAQRSEDASYVYRVYAWQAARQMFLERPVLGVGAGSFAAAFYEEFTIPDRGRGRWMQAHNVYYQVLSELGLAGVLCFGLLLYLMFRTFRRCRRGWAEVEGNAISPLVEGAEVGLVVLLVTGWAGHNLYRFPYYLLASLAMIADRLTQARVLVVEGVVEPDQTADWGAGNGRAGRALPAGASSAVGPDRG